MAVAAKKSAAHVPGCRPAPYNAALVLADGSVFYGYGIGKTGTGLGELCFNTAMTGYQEVLTDPSYTGEIITFTFPHIGNVGTNDEDVESGRAHASGLVIRNSITEPSNYRALSHLDMWLKKKKVTGISGVDTRRLTNLLRKSGPQNGVIWFGELADEADVSALQAQAQKHPSLKGMELAKKVANKAPYEWEQGIWEWDEGYLAPENPQYKVVAIGFGEKQNILRNLTKRGCAVTTVPAGTSADTILALKPDGVFLSNGPGDPAATGKYAVKEIKALVESGLPLFGICLGHQLLALALGAETDKMHQGHRGANHPVKDLTTGKVEITSQNHGFEVKEAGLPEHIEITHRSLFDNCIEGIRLKGKPVFSVQYHPESSPGPHDSGYLFDRFVENIESRVGSRES